MVSSELKEQAAKWVMAKGLGVTVLIFMQLTSLYTINQLWKFQESLQKQMFELQNAVIKDNTKALTEFNSKYKRNERTDEHSGW